MDIYNLIYRCLLIFSPIIFKQNFIQSQIIHLNLAYLIREFYLYLIVFGDFSLNLYISKVEFTIVRFIYNPSLNLLIIVGLEF